jgi:hypothetical protein
MSFLHLFSMAYDGEAFKGNRRLFNRINAFLAFAANLEPMPGRHVEHAVSLSKGSQKRYTAPDGLDYEALASRIREGISTS